MQDPNNINPEDIEEFLKGEPAVTTVPLDLDPDQVGTIATPQEPEELLDSPLRQEFEPDVQSAGSEVLWTLQASPDLKVEVSELERNLFWKASLNDEPVKLSMYVRDVEVVCRTLSQFEMDVMFAALDQDTTKRVVLTEGQYASQMQDYCLFCQILQVGDQAFNHRFDASTYQDMGEAAQALRLHYARVSKIFNQARRSCLIHAIRVFSIKMKLCTDNLHNENFWIPPEED